MIDILFTQVMDARVLENAVARALGIREEDVRFVKDDDDDVANLKIQVVGKIEHLRGDVCCLVMLFWEQSLTYEEEQEFARRLCAYLKVEAIISDDNANPYTWLLVRPDGGIEPVSFDPICLEFDEYKLVRGGLSGTHG